MEQQQFEAEIGRIESIEQEGVMEIVTSWMENGIQQEALNFALRLLKRKFGKIDSEIEAQVQTLSVVQLEELGEALLDFSPIADLTQWLEQNKT